MGLVATQRRTHFLREGGGRLMFRGVDIFVDLHFRNLSIQSFMVLHLNVLKNLKIKIQVLKM
jgi:hypothetical protein